MDNLFASLGFARSHRSLQRCLLLLWVLLVSGCVVNPVTGKTELAALPDAQIEAQAAEQYGPVQQIQGGPYTLDANLTAYVNRIGSRLGVSSGVRLPYEFVIVNDSSVNAWALPGGKIGINRGLLMMMENEAELAAVLAHEVAHAAARHGHQRANRAFLSEGLWALANAGLQVAGVESGGEFVGVARQAASVFGLTYSRDAEREADFYGTEFMARAGYNPAAAVSLQQKFVAMSGGGQVPYFLRSHPTSQERVDNNQRRARELVSSGYGGGRLGAAEYQRATAQLRRHADAYELYDDAQGLYREKQYNDALLLVDEAISAYVAEGLFHGLRGSVLLAQDRLAEAIRSFDAAISRNPNYYALYLGRGVAQHRRGDFTASERDLSRSVRLLSTSTAYEVLAAIAQARGDTTAAEEYSRRAANFR